MKKLKFFLASEIDKEAEWLTDMSEQGLHFYKYKFPFYYFEEDPNTSYVYQTDFPESEVQDDYFRLYEDAGWEHVTVVLESFHYFRAEKDKIGEKRIYTDPDSLKALYERMLRFYLLLFLVVMVAQIGMLLTWQGWLFQKVALGLVIVVVVLYAILFIRLLRKSR